MVAYIKKCSEAIVNEAFNSLIGQLSLLFTNIIDSLTSRQISFLIAVADGVVNFSSKDILKHYQLGTSANIKNLKKATLEKDLIDILPGNTIEIKIRLLNIGLKMCIRILQDSLIYIKKSGGNR